MGLNSRLANLAILRKNNAIIKSVTIFRAMRYNISIFMLKLSPNYITSRLAILKSIHLVKEIIESQIVDIKYKQTKP